MPRIRLRVYDTQNNSWNFDQDVEVETTGDVKELIGFAATTRYTKKDDRQDPFSNLQERITGDLTIFASPARSKAG